MSSSLPIILADGNFPFWVSNIIGGAALLLSFAAIYTSRADRNADEIRGLRDETVRNRTLIEVMEKRLAGGEIHFNRLDVSQHQLEVKVLEALNDLRGVVATKDDLRSMREEMRNA